jgi:flagellar protein FlbT
MALIIDLKPSERVIIGSALITNDKSRTRLHIEGSAPILREKDIMRVDDADTPCKKIYMFLQMMYLSAHPEDMHKEYFDLVKMIQDAAPSTSVYFMEINDMIYEGKYYNALKRARDLIDYEKELTSNVA